MLGRMKMSRRMTVVFHNEELYTDLKVEAARRHMAASDIIAEAVQEWLDAKESEELLPLHLEAIAEYEEKGGRSWEEVEKEWEAAIGEREKQSVVAEKKDVYN
jgi:hypothetical protein